jgi:AbrB family looped-hinge helix DNA binding protein
MGVKGTATPERVQRVGRGGRITIPREILQRFKLREGDLVAFRPQENGVLINPKQTFDPDDILTPLETRKLSHGLKQVKDGKTKPWPRIKDDLGL